MGDLKRDSCPESRIAEGRHRTWASQPMQLQQLGVTLVHTCCCLCNCVILLGNSSGLEAEKSIERFVIERTS